MSDALDDFKRSIQVLALPVQVQLSLLPGGIAKGDELMIDFSESLQQVRQHLEKVATTRQLQTIKALDNYADSISRMQNEELWFDDDTLILDSRWQKIHDLADDVLSAFGWENVPPTMGDRVYVVDSSGHDPRFWNRIKRWIKNRLVHG